MIFGKPAEALDHVVGDRLGEARDPGKKAVAARLHGRIEVEVGREPEQRRDDPKVEQIFVGDLGELRDHDFERPVLRTRRSNRGRRAGGRPRPRR